MEQTKEYEATNDLLYPLAMFQGLVDPTECEQPVSGACGLEECESGERCASCVQAMSRAGTKEYVAPSPLPKPERLMAKWSQERHER